MFKYSRDFSDNQNVYYDICIIGSGPAGISVAKEFLGNKIKIVMLESGSVEPDSKYDVLNEGINSGPTYLALDSARIRCFGGASRIWAGVCSPFSPEDFVQKSYFPLSGWPINYKNLNPFYKQAAEFLIISYENFFRTDYFTTFELN